MDDFFHHSKLKTYGNIGDCNFEVRENESEKNASVYFKIQGICKK
jgi:hypothetical protein